MLQLELLNIVESFVCSLVRKNLEMDQAVRANADVKKFLPLKRWLGFRRPVQRTKKRAVKVLKQTCHLPILLGINMSLDVNTVNDELYKIVPSQPFCPVTPGTTFSIVFSWLGEGTFLNLTSRQPHSLRIAFDRE